MKSSGWQTRRVWIAGTAVLAALLLAAAWFLAISPKRSDAASTRSQAQAVQTQNDALAASNAALARQKAHLKTFQYHLGRALMALPGNSELPQLTVAVTAAAKRTHVDLRSITIGGQAPVAPAAAAVPAATSSAPAPSSSGSDTTDTTETTPAAAAPTAAQYSIPVTFEVSGAQTADVAFVHALESGARAASITSAQLSSSGKSANLTVQMNVFTAPLTPAQAKQLLHLLTSHS